MVIAGVVVAAALVATGGAPGRVRPVDLEALIVAPGSEVRPRWAVDGPGPWPYVIRDLDGREVQRGEAAGSAPALVETLVRPPHPGYYEVEFPGSAQRFGLLAIDPPEGKPDTFFGVDGAMSWLVHDEPRRRSLVGMAGRLGIGMVRERVSLSRIAPGPDRREWQSADRYDGLRALYRERQLPLLEMGHDAPRWMGRLAEKYPGDLAAWARLSGEVARRWGASWGGIELWNEPDIAFGGDLPGDQYAAVAKATAFGAAEGGWEGPIVGGAVAHFQAEFLDAVSRSGLLPQVDAWSFHTYGRAAQMEDQVGHFRGWLRAAGAGDMPLWITESGRPWPRGTDRPALAQDLESARDVTAKAIEAKACGVERYFAFVLPYYEENANNFGMTDRDGTPLRVLAAYAQAIRAVGNRPYRGDLRLPSGGEGLLRARVFGSGDDVVAVLLMQKTEPGSTLDLGMPVRRVEGLDGRPLACDDAGRVPVGDGLVYVGLEEQVADSHLDRQTAAMRLHPSGRWSRRNVSDIVLRHEFDPQKVQPSPRGYRLSGSESEPYPLSVRVFNLGPASRRLRLSVALERGEPPAPQELEVAAGGSALAHWALPVAELLEVTGRTALQVEASEDASAVVDRIPIVLLGEPTLEALGKRFGDRRELPIRELERWRVQASGPEAARIDVAGDGSWRLVVRHGPETDRWAYPTFELPEGVRLPEGGSLVLRGRCERPATVRVFLWEGSGGVGYLTPDSIVPADGKWHVAVIPFRELVESGANAVDPDHRLDLAAVRRIGVGINSASNENTLEVSDVWLVGP